VSPKIIEALAANPKYLAAVVNEVNRVIEAR
jgi:hypothetical protein